MKVTSVAAKQTKRFAEVDHGTIPIAMMRRDLDGVRITFQLKDRRFTLRFTEEEMGWLEQYIRDWREKKPVEV